MARQDPKTDQVVLAVYMYLNNLLPKFERHLSGIQVHYDMQRDQFLVRAQVVLPWGDSEAYGCTLFAMDVQRMQIGEMANFVCSELTHIILEEDEIKEEVSEGLLPIECLDQLRSIERMPRRA